MFTFYNEHRDENLRYLVLPKRHNSQLSYTCPQLGYIPAVLFTDICSVK